MLWHVVFRSVLTAEEDRELAAFVTEHFSGYHSLKSDELEDLRMKLEKSVLPATITQVRKISTEVNAVAVHLHLSRRVIVLSSTDLPPSRVLRKCNT